VEADDHRLSQHLAVDAKENRYKPESESPLSRPSVEPSTSRIRIHSVATTVARSMHRSDVCVSQVAAEVWPALDDVVGLQFSGDYLILGQCVAGNAFLLRTGCLRNRTPKLCKFAPRLSKKTCLGWLHCQVNS
jgi:hypothetical protein